LEFISKNQEFEGPLGEEFGYVNLWDVGALHEAWEGYKFQDNLSDQWFPIGSNRGGEIIVIDLSSDEKELFYIPFITQSELDADYYGDDFSELYDAVKQYLRGCTILCVNEGRTLVERDRREHNVGRKESFPENTGNHAGSRGSAARIKQSQVDG
jgi:hypothetical protein